MKTQPKEAYYFSHDANARHDPKIAKMLCKYKYGYQWYFMIVEILREQADFKYKMDEYYSNAIARDLHEDSDAIEIFIQDCIKEFGLFVSDEKYFWSESLLRRMKIKTEKSKIYRENAKKRWDKKASNGNANTMQLHSNSNAVKESKVNKSKVNKNLITNIPFSNFPELNNDSFKTTFIKWIEHKKQNKTPLTDIVISEQLEFLSTQSKPVECLKQSLRNGYKGLFEVKVDNPKSKVPDSVTNKKIARVKRNLKAANELIERTSR